MLMASIDFRQCSGNIGMDIGRNDFIYNSSAHGAFSVVDPRSLKYLGVREPWALLDILPFLSPISFLSLLQLKTEYSFFLIP